VHLLVVMTAERGLCGGFNSSIVKLARAEDRQLKAEGKTVKILTVGKKGREQLKRDYADLFVGPCDLSDVKRLGYADASRYRATCWAASTPASSTSPRSSSTASSR
jgi:F-type H+-transporting ATPase subunit gamma